MLYVGKAKSLRKRVLSYFRAPLNPDDPTSLAPRPGSHPKTADLVDRIDRVEVLITGGESEALILEANLVKRHRPQFNIRLRDDKSYPYIAISLDEEYPRVYFTRERHRRDRVYFGPFSNASKVRETLNVLARIFPSRPCEGPEPGRPSGIPCLDYHIKRCLAPCVDYITKAEYRALIDQIIAFLSGRYRGLERELDERMRAASEAQEFEQAAIHRNRLAAVRHLMERQWATNEGLGTLDVIGVAMDGDAANVQVLQVRDGVMQDRQSFHLELARRGRPGRRGRAVRHRVLRARDRDPPAGAGAVAGRGRGASPSSSASGAAAGSRSATPSAATSAGSRIWPRATPGSRSTRTASVTSSPAIAAAIPSRSSSGSSTCRRRRSASSATTSPTSAPPMRPPRWWSSRAVRPPSASTGRSRRATRATPTTSRGSRRSSPAGSSGLPRAGTTASFAQRPGLVVIDGGKGQLGAALRGMAAAGIDDVPVVSLAKRIRGGVRARAGRTRSSSRKARRGSASCKRSETRPTASPSSTTAAAAIKGMTGSILDALPGIGPSRRAAILRHFGSPERFLQASIDELAGVPGLPPKVARDIYDRLHKTAIPAGVETIAREVAESS